MEKENQENIPQVPDQEEAKAYTPRPAWQVWAARIGLVLFIFLVIIYYLLMFRGAL